VQRTSVERVAETEEERRRFERADLVVRIEYTSIDDLFSEFTHDINEGGLFIETEQPCAIGSTVQLQFHLPGSDAPVKTRGIVVRHDDGADGRAPGMAVEFDELDPAERERINTVVRSMRTRR